MDNKQLYKITLTREQLMLISQCVEDISRFAAGDMDLQHTTDTLIRAWGCAANAGGWLPVPTDVMSWYPVNGTGSS